MSRAQYTIDAKRWIIKIGSALLTKDGKGLDYAAIEDWSEQIAQRMQQGARLKQASGSNPLKEVAKDLGGEMKEAITGSKQGAEGATPSKQTEPVILTPEDQDIIKQLETKANKVHFDVNIRLLASTEAGLR